ncbi:tripartite-type tricarboxylate transporter receptor subunit TctC [Pseudacidovorax sp. 1753]|uniref:Bug family tripartite tricarboxylate transporter substrate binding protein n=1 Tax=Pseudacidovorax sp. 1753 TaxID=3156419 RepID=UPI003398DBAF
MQPSSLRRRQLVLGTALAGIGARTALAAGEASTYPERPIRLIVGFPACGSADQSARRLADQMSRQLGKPIVIDNRPGASGNIAAAAAARSAADGYTLFYGTNATQAMNVSLYPRLDYDPIKDFVPIALEGKVYNVMCTHPAFRPADVASLLSQVRASPGSLAVATPGNATSGHLSLVLLQRSARVQFTHVPYKGSAPAVTDVIGGQVPILFDNVAGTITHIRAGKLRPLAVTAARRLPLLPDVPTFEELGLRDCVMAAWGGLWAPAGTPAPIVQRLNAEMNQALATAAVVDRMRELTVEPVGGSSEAAAAFVIEETQRWREVLHAAGIRLD